VLQDPYRVYLVEEMLDILSSHQTLVVRNYSLAERQRPERKAPDCGPNADGSANLGIRLIRIALRYL
jgi:hypothetical protein